VNEPKTTTSVRVSPHGYTSALLVASFAAAFLFYIEFDLFGLILFFASWIVFPVLAFRDEITFDGRRLRRTGFLPGTWTFLNGARSSLKLSDIEQVETHAVRALRRGGSIYYRYKTVIRGKGISLTIASGGRDFRKMVRAILTKLPDNILDTRSIELRDFLNDPKETLSRAEDSRIPSADALERTFRSVLRGRKPHTPTTSASEKFDELRSLANELRVSGHLLQAVEAFRRALLVRPTDARLIFEFARCLHSLAGVRRDNKLERRALAALRLSEMRAEDDGELLVRLGEWYFQIGEWRRAGNVFKTALDKIGENFRLARGFAELALREGKIAHVIHHFAAAGRVAETPSLRRWSKSEAEYFSNLNSDGEYMELEVARVNMLETVERSRKTALRIVFLGLVPIAIGVLVADYFVANIGWAISSVALVVWVGMIVISRMLVQRIPYHLVESDE